MPTSTANIVLSVGGVSVTGLISRDGEGQISAEPTLAAGNAGTLSTRTNDTAGTLTCTGHDISTGDIIDIGWTDANGDFQVARKATVGTVAGDSIPFTGSSGVVLPAQDYAIVCDERVNIIGEVDFDGDELVMIVLHSTRNGHYDFVDSTPTTLDQGQLLAGEPFFWYFGMSTNPLTGNPVDDLWVTNLDGVNTATVKLGGRLDTV